MKNSRSKFKIPTPPKFLGPEGRKVWKRVLLVYDLDDTSTLILEAVCQAVDRWHQAREQIAESGTTTVDRFGQAKVHPAVLIERDSRAAAIRGLKQLGLDLEPLNPGPGRPNGR